MKKKTIVMLLTIIMTAFAACGQSAEEAVNPQIEAVESTDEVEGDEDPLGQTPLGQAPCRHGIVRDFSLTFSLWSIMPEPKQA